MNEILDHPWVMNEKLAELTFYYIKLLFKENKK